MTLDYRKAAQWLIKAMSSASMDADDNICMHCLKTNSATVQSKLTGWTFCDSRCFKSAQSGNPMYQLIAAGKKREREGEEEEDEEAVREAERLRREEEAAAQRAATAREAARWHKEQQGGVFNEQVAEILKHMKNNPLFLEELANSISLEQVEVWSRTARAFKEYINNNAAFWYYFLRTLQNRFIPKYLVENGFDVTMKEEYGMFGKWLVLRQKLQSRGKNPDLATCNFILRYPQWIREILFWQFETTDSETVLAKLFYWWLWDQQLRDVLHENETFWRLIYQRGYSSGFWRKGQTYFQTIFEDQDVGELSYQIHIEEYFKTGEDIEKEQVDDLFEFFIFGKKSLQTHIRETLSTIYNSMSYKANFVKPEIIVPRSEVADALHLQFEGAWEWEGADGDQNGDEIGRAVNAYPIPDHAPTPFDEDAKNPGENTFTLRIALEWDFTPRIIIKTGAPADLRRDLTLGDIQALQNNPDFIEEIVKYDSNFWKLEHLFDFYKEYRAKPLAVEIYYETEKIYSFPVTELEMHDILNDILLDTVTRWPEFTPRTKHTYLIQLLGR